MVDTRLYAKTHSTEAPRHPALRSLCSDADCLGQPTPHCRSPEQYHDSSFRAHRHRSKHLAPPRLRTSITATHHRCRQHYGQYSLQQVLAGNPPMLLSLLDDETAAGAAPLDFFLLNKRPWSLIENDQAFVCPAPQ